eukprot:245267_1
MPQMAVGFTRFIKKYEGIFNVVAGLTVVLLALILAVWNGGVLELTDTKIIRDLNAVNERYANDNDIDKGLFLYTKSVIQLIWFEGVKASTDSLKVIRSELNELYSNAQEHKTDSDKYDRLEGLWDGVLLGKCYVDTLLYDNDALEISDIDQLDVAVTNTEEYYNVPDFMEKTCKVEAGNANGCAMATFLDSYDGEKTTKLSAILGRIQSLTEKGLIGASAISNATLSDTVNKLQSQ